MAPTLYKPQLRYQLKGPMKSYLVVQVLAANHVLHWLRVDQSAVDYGSPNWCEIIRKGAHVNVTKSSKVGDLLQAVQG